jgi:hypothetical protein
MAPGSLALAVGDEQVVMIDQLATGLAAGVEAGLVAAALPVQRQQAETLALVRRGFLAAGPDPVLQDVLAEGEQLGRIAGPRDSSASSRASTSASGLTRVPWTS